MAALLLGLLACHPAAPPDVHEVALVVTADVSGTAVATVVVEVTGPGITNSLTFNLPITDGIATATITVPTGADRTFAARAFDAGGVETHRASVTLDIEPGSAPRVAFVLEPLVEGLTIEVTLRGSTIVVSPGSVALVIGQTAALNVTVLDSNGDPVPTTVNWATRNPGVASVDADGMVTARRAGETHIVATSRGAAGSAVVTVTSP